jgi:RNA polymerase sigma-70 factor (ECF subfamily)
VTDPTVPPSRDGDPSTSLLLRVQANDQAAWDRLVHLFTPLVYSWCRQSGLQPADAENVFQEVFLAVSYNLHTFRRDRPGDSFRGWLRVITRHKIADHFRKKVEGGEGGSDAQKRLQQVPAPDLPDDDPETMQSETSLIYRRALDLIKAEFEPTTWQAFEAVMLQGLSSAETAKAVGISVNAVYLARSRILKRLRDEFEDLLDD